MIARWCQRFGGLLLVLGSSLAFAASAAAAVEPTLISGRAMGTTWSVKFVGSSPTAPSAESLREVIARELEFFEQEFSTYRPTSTLSRFNATPSTEWFPVSGQLAEIATVSHHIHRLTKGAFEPTVAPLLALWGFGPGGRVDAPPSEAMIAAARARVGYLGIDFRRAGKESALRKTSPHLAVDFSSIAKGAAADRLSDLLTAQGVGDHFVQIGGDIKTRGHPPDASAWRTGIENPLPSARPALAQIVALSGQALSTSGDARNFVMIAGQRYGHILDPRTGRPVTGPLASVSVIAESCAFSSALATALFVLGPEDGFTLARSQRLACLFIVRSGETTVHHATPEFEACTVADAIP